MFKNLPYISPTLLPITVECKNILILHIDTNIGRVHKMLHKQNRCCMKFLC